MISSTSGLRDLLERKNATVLIPNIPLSRTGISPGIYQNWKNAGIVYNNQVEKEDKQSEDDNKRIRVNLNLLEYAWIKFVEQLRIYGVPIATIYEFKKLLFTPIIETREEVMERYKNLAYTEDIKMTRELFEELKSYFMDHPEILLSNSIYDSYINTAFGNAFILNTFLNIEANFIVRIVDGKYQILPLTHLLALEVQIQEAYAVIRTGPHLSIPINSILIEFIDQPKNKDYLTKTFKLTDQEWKLIDSVRKEDFDEMIITYKINSDDEKKLCITKTKGKTINDSDARVVRQLLSIGSYDKVEIINRNHKESFIRTTSKTTF